MIELAKTPEQRQMEMQAPRYQAPLVQPQQKQSVTDMAKEMGTQMAVNAAGKGVETHVFPKVASMFAGPTMSGTATPLMKAGVDASLANAMGTQAVAQGAGGAGLMAGIGTAMPYIGAGLIAGKALGFFSQGGPVMAGPLSKIRYKSNGGKVKEEIEATYSGPLGG